MSEYTVVFAAEIPYCEIVDSDNCRHSGPDALVIGGRIEQREYTCEFNFCMACGTITPVSGRYAHWFEAFALVYREFGWHAGINARLHEFAKRATRSRIEAGLALRGAKPGAVPLYEWRGKSVRNRKLDRLRAEPRQTPVALSTARRARALGMIERFPRDLRRLPAITRGLVFA